MATSYTSLLGLALPVTGELDGTWGDTVNNSITELVEDAIAATATASVASGDWTLSTTGSGAANEARCAILIPTGSPGVSRNIIAPSQSKAYIVINKSDAAVVLKGAATTGTTIGAGVEAVCAWDGSDFVTVASTAATVSSISFGTTGLTPNTATTGAVSVSGTLNVANGGTGSSSLTLNNVLLGNGTSAVQAVAPGSSGNVLTSDGTTWASSPPAPGGIDYVVKTANYTTQNNEGVLADTSGGAFTVTLPATPSAGDQVVVADPTGDWGTNNLTVGRNGSTISGVAQDLVCDISGVSVQLVYDGTTWAVYAQVGGNGGTAVTLNGVQTLTNKTINGANNTLTVRLANDVTGTLPVANGGTGATSLTANNVLLGNGTSAVQTVAPGASGNVLISNGTTWTSSALSADPVGTLQYFAGATTTTYPGSTWLNCDGSVLTQTTYSSLYSRIGLIQNGVATWTARTSGTVSNLGAVTYGNSLYVYGGAGGVLATSTDAVTWTARTSQTTSQINSIVYENNLYVYVANSGKVGTSANGTTWTAQSSGTTQALYDVTYGNGIYVFCGEADTIKTSTDAITWTTRTPGGTSSNLDALIYANNLYVCAGTGGVLKTSTDAITWTDRTSGTASTIRSLTYGNNLYVYAGDGGVLATSTNAITWTARTSGTASIIRKITYYDGLFTYVGAGGVLATSADAITWTARTSGVTQAIYGLTYGGGLYVFAADGGVLRTASAYTYNTATEFILPQTSATQLMQYNATQLFIKAQ